MGYKVRFALMTTSYSTGSRALTTCVYTCSAILCFKIFWMVHSRFIKTLFGFCHWNKLIIIPLCPPKFHEIEDGLTTSNFISRSFSLSPAKAPHCCSIHITLIRMNRNWRHDERFENMQCTLHLKCLSLSDKVVVYYFTYFTTTPSRYYCGGIYKCKKTLENFMGNSARRFSML